MKKLFLVCAFVLGVSAVSMAQGGGGRMRMKPEEQTAQLKTQIPGITDDQATKLTAIFTEAAKKRDSLMTAANGDRQVMMAGMMKMQPIVSTKVKAVLTEEQGKAYQKIVDERAAAMKARMQGN